MEAINKPKKKRILSGCTVTGDLTLGNYIGAIKQWNEIMDDFDCFFMLANLHALTVPQVATQLHENTLKFFAQYLAIGLDPKRCTLFIQSQVPEHAQLNWILTCLAPLGNLQRMTQFKDKSSKSKNITAGLMLYPCLMASDILLYDANLVPVGEDQTQHMEFTRDMVIYFHNTYGETFTLPKGYYPKIGARIMSLADPSKKMSKSDENPKAFISLIDPLKVIEKKIKSAVTDSGSKIFYDPEKNPGIANLLTIHSVLSKKDFSQLELEYEGKLYGHLKSDLAQIVCETIKPIQERYNQFMNNKDYLNEMIEIGRIKACEQAQKVLERVYNKTGLYRP